LDTRQSGYASAVRFQGTTRNWI